MVDPSAGTTVSVGCSCVPSCKVGGAMAKTLAVAKINIAILKKNVISFFIVI